MNPLRWSTSTVVKATCVCVVAYLALSGFANFRADRNTTANGERGTRIESIVRDVKHIGQKIDEQTSPAAQRRQKDAIHTILVTVDCNTRAALQEAIDGLVRQGLIQPAAVRLIGPACAHQGG